MKVSKCTVFFSLPLIKRGIEKREKTVYFGTPCDPSREKMYNQGQV